MPEQRKDAVGIDLVDEGLPGLVELLMRRWRIIVCGHFIGVLVGSALYVGLPKQYEAEATVIAASQLGSGPSLGNLGQLTSAVSGLGVGIGMDHADPSFLFPWILRNRRVSTRILVAKHTDRDGNEVQLIDQISGPAETPEHRLAKARRTLHERVLRYDKDRKSGVARVKVRLADPVLAAAVVNNCLEELDAFYGDLKSRMAGGEYGFIAQRLQQVKLELATSEDKMLEFRQTNRSVLGSPALMLEQERLERDLQLNQQLYLTLHTQLEIAGIEQEKQLPVLAILDHGAPPVEPVSPRLVSLLLVWTLIGWFVALLGILVHNAVLVRGERAGSL